MPILEFLIIIIAVGVILWAVNRYIPMQASVQKLMNIVVLVGLVLWILSLFGLFGAMSHIRIGR